MNYEDIKHAASVLSEVSRWRDYVTKERFCLMAKARFGIEYGELCDVMYGLMQMPLPRLIAYMSIEHNGADGNAQPVYWGVMESTLRGVPEGCGIPIIYMGDGATMSTAEAVAYIEKEYLKDLDEANQQEWADLDKNDMVDVVRFMNENLDWSQVRVVYLRKQERISHETGAFLTKRACKAYIERFGYNHSNPHTYAMTAYRNFELERLLTILKNINFEQQ